MNNHSFDVKNFLLFATLPFVELDHETTIQFGPIIFWPASKSDEFLPESNRASFHDYLQMVGQIKAKELKNQVFINTGFIDAKKCTCASIASEVPEEIREFLLIDALYLLYFACTFRNLYYGQEIPPFNSLRKMIPAHEEFIKDQSLWKDLYIHETDREETICLHVIDSNICEGLGKALEAIYLGSGTDNPEFIQTYKRIVRSIRYLIDRFFQRFVNLFGKNLNFSEEIFEPEDIIFLTVSFECLFNLEGSGATAADFKHKLRPLLHLKYSRPVEIFWKWVDDFYEVKQRILRGDTFLDPLFRWNPNFEVSHILLGIKLFIYSIYYYLFTYQLLESTRVDPYTPPDFKWIHPEEILLFFWTESAVLEKIHLFLQESEKGPLTDEFLSDLNLLTTLFVSLYDRYYVSEQIKGAGIVRFLPSSVADLKKIGQQILDKFKQMNENDPIMKNVHPYFAGVLEDRLNEQRLKLK